LSHVVNLENVDIMQNITKIAAVENAMAIWEYDPTQPDNRVLGGSLDVIAAIHTLAIKVSVRINFLIFTTLMTFCDLRYKLPDNELNTFTARRYVVDFLKPLKSRYTAISDGEQHSKCLTRQTNSVR